VVNTNTTQISLVWSDESRADTDFVQYQVFTSTTTGGPYTLAGTTTITSAVVSNLTTGVPYYFIVRGQDAASQLSAPSPERSGTPSTITAPNPSPLTCPNPLWPPVCEADGSPDGLFENVSPTQTLVLDFGPNNGVLNGPGYDLVYYEREADPLPTGYIQMDWVNVELSLDGVMWSTPFAWRLGNESLAQNSNVWLFASDDPSIAACLTLPAGAGAAENEVIYMPAGGPGGICPAWPGLYQSPPPSYQTGIAIDISGIPAPTGEGYRYIRITAPGPEPAEVDGIERLN
jgi:hypothetical protein